MTIFAFYDIIFGQSEDSRFKVKAKLPAEERYKHVFCVFLRLIGLRKDFLFFALGQKKMLGCFIIKKGGEIMPSAKVLESKKQIVADLTERLKNSAAGVIVKYEGITVEKDTALRAELRKAGVEYTVIKNTLTKRACENVGFDELTKDLEGMTAVATSAEDPVIAAKILKKYADAIESFEIKSGFVDGGVIDAKGVDELATLPSKEQLIGKVLGSLQSSLYSLAYVLQAIVDKDGGNTESVA